MLLKKNDSADVCVSVVIPCYNAQDFIAETVRSVLDQSFGDFEIIIVDDGSTDNSAAIITSLQAEDARIFVLSKTNSGVSDSRNRGLEMSSGKYIVFFDADDIMMPDFLSARVKTLSGNPQAGYCASGIITIDKDGVPFGDVCSRPFVDPFEDILYYRKGTVTCPSNFMCNTGILKKTGIKFNSKLVSSADRFFWMELSAEMSFFPVGDCASSLLKYRVHAASMSNTISLSKAADVENLFFEIKKKIYSRIPDKDFFKKKYYYMISGSYYRAGGYQKAFYYGLAYLYKKVTSPRRK
jgi:glycosyltransferase involved in cell wall biosynthesis